MNTKVVLFLNKSLIRSKMCNILTGCYAYHTGFLIEDTNMFYDMYWMRRRREWHTITSNKEYKFEIYDAPVEIPETYLINQILDSGNVVYGVKDYAKFVVRPIYHVLGKSTRNSNGIICSEMVELDLIAHGWNSPLRTMLSCEPPSPCDLWKFFNDRTDYNKSFLGV